MKSGDRATSLFHLFAGTLLAFGLLWLYWPILSHLVVKLAEDEDYSYGLLLPLISGYLVYQKWPQLRATTWRPSWSGMAIMLLSFAICIIGQLGTGVYLARLSFVIFLSGLIFFLGGGGLLRLLTFPLFLLLMALPPPFIFTSKLTLPLQLLSSRLAAEMLSAIGIPVLRQGNVIDLGYTQLQLVAACSGLRYILSLLALGCIYCYFYQRRSWKIAILLLALIPSAVIANALRVAAMGIYPPIQKEGFLHAFSGWLIFVFCIALMVLINELLNRLQAPAYSSGVTSSGDEAAHLVKEDKPQLNRYLIAALAVVFLAVPAERYLTYGRPVPLLQGFDKFPLQLGPWQGYHTYVAPDMVKATGADAHLSMDFSAPGEKPISLWIAYYQSQETGSLAHNPKDCLTGSGWETKESGNLDIGPNLPVSYMVLETGGNRILVYYWFMQRGRWVTRAQLSKLYLIYDALRTHRKDGALIRLITPTGMNIETDQEYLSNFARLLTPVLSQFIPN